MLITNGAGLQGKEVPLVSLKGLLNFWQVTREGAAKPKRWTCAGTWCPSVTRPALTYLSDCGWKGSCIEGSIVSIAPMAGCSSLKRV